MGHDPPPLPSRDVHAVRWYVLPLPTCHKDPAEGLKKGLDRRMRLSEPTFDFFTPSFVEMRRRKGHLVETHRPLPYDCVFIHSSVYEIFRLKRDFPSCNFLPSVDDHGSYPFVSDCEMEDLRWVAHSCSGELPMYMPEAGYLCKSGRIRIMDDRSEGVETSVVVQPDVGERGVTVCVDNWIWVSLLHVQPGEYEVTSLAEEGGHVYTRLDDSRIQNGLYETLGRHQGSCGVTAADRELAAGTLRTCGGLQLDSVVMRCKLYSLLLPAYTILRDEERQKSLVGTIVSFLSLARAEQSLALLLLTLYGCTDGSTYYYRAYELIDPWNRESSPEKSKLSLVHRLTDYDRWLKHNG